MPSRPLALMTTLVPVTAAVVTPAMYVFLCTLPTRIVFDSLAASGWRATGRVVETGGVVLERADTDAGVLRAGSGELECLCAQCRIASPDERPDRRDILQRVGAARRIVVGIARRGIRRPSPAWRHSHQQDESSDHKTSESIHRVLRAPGSRRGVREGTLCATAVTVSIFRY